MWSTWATGGPWWSTRPATPPLPGAGPPAAAADRLRGRDPPARRLRDRQPRAGRRRGAQVLAPRGGRLGSPTAAWTTARSWTSAGSPSGPGHPGARPRARRYLLLDGPRPVALFSGGSLLVGTVARTDLISPERTEALARALYRSMHERLLVLPDDLAVYPTHGAGSFCATPAGGQRTTTIGAERRHNPLLAAPDEDAFVAQLLAGFGTYPPYFLRLRERNRSAPSCSAATRSCPCSRPTRSNSTWPAAGWWSTPAPSPPSPPATSPDRCRSRCARQFASWLGWLLDDTRPLVFVLDEDQDRGELARQCRTIGYDHLVGELAGGMAAWRAAGLPRGPAPAGRGRTTRRPAWRGAGCPPGQRDRRRPPPRCGRRRAGRPWRRPAPGAAPAGAGHGDVRPRRAGHDRRQPPRAAGHKDLSVVHGGPQDWQRATGQALARS